MVTISMHSPSAPIFKHLLANILAWLDKAQAHADARKFDDANYLGLRLAPDMLPLTRQAQIASDAAKGCMARLARVEVPKWDDKSAGGGRANVSASLELRRAPDPGALRQLLGLSGR